MLKRRALSFLLVFVMIVSLLPSAVLASGETDAIAIQEKTITTSTTTVTVKVTGYEGLSNATLRLSVGPDGTESDWGISNPPRTALGSLKYTGPDTYTFAIDPAKLAAGKNVQAYLYYWSDSRDDWAYTYGDPVEITDGDPGAVRVDRHPERHQPHDGAFGHAEKSPRKRHFPCDPAGRGGDV